ncbi:MAG: hypothetical protein AAFU86_16625 [Pseudomonadota bacterium]
MSYQPPPDFDKENPRLAARLVGLKHMAQTHPMVIWVLVWLFCVFVAGHAFWSENTQILTQRPSVLLMSLFALVGWIVPFAMLIRQKRDAIK